MQKTVNEIIDMIDEGKLHYGQSTQRKFIYFTINKKTEDGEITKAGNVIRSILQLDIQLPALFFWEKENGKYNIHDGKQRVLSIYYFIKPTKEINVVTRINGKETTYNGLTEEQKDKLLKYKFDITVKKGDEKHEENSFYEINTNSEPLTDYESLRGMFHGKWIYEFENYLESKSKVVDKIKKVGRGEQAIYFLYNCFKLLGDKNEQLKVREFLRGLRGNNFTSEDYKMDDIINIYSEILRIEQIQDTKIIQVASYIVEKNWDREKIIDYYRKISKRDNDLKSWKIETHKMAINKLIQENIECDGKRYFTDNDKSSLYKRSQSCAEVSCKIDNYKELEVDHKLPWSHGGKTILDNGQLLCKSHNASKSDEDGEKG